MNLLSNLYNLIHPDSDKDPDQAQRSFIAAHSIAPNTHAGKMAAHYLWGNGKDYTYPAENIRKERTVKIGEYDNNYRLLQSMLEPKKLYTQKDIDASREAGSLQSLSDLKEGERVYLKNTMDSDVSSISEDHPIKRSTLWDGSLNTAFGLGSYKLHSKSYLQLKKAKDKILLYGYVEHQIKDRYDFHGEGFLGKTGQLLEKEGRAKPFNTTITWRTRPYGVITVRDDNIDTSGVVWE